MAKQYVSKDNLLYLARLQKDTFVAKEEGKGLSTNDYTNAEKEKLAGVAAGAQVNVLEGVKVNGQALTATDKVVDVTVPTKVSELTNDANYITIDDVPEGVAASTSTPLMASADGAVGTGLTYARADHQHPSDTSKVDKTTTVNGKALSGNINLSAADVGAVPTTTKVNGQALSSDVTLDYEDVGAAPAAHSHDVATNSVAGYMSAADKAKLDGIAEGATKTIVDSAMSETSSNPVENKVVYAELAKKAAADHTHNYAGSATPGGPATTALECTGNSATATALQTARKITVGNKEQSFDGTADVAFTIAEIGAIPASAKGAANGVATLDSNGQIPSAQLPSYVDDVVEGYYYNGEFYKEEAHSTKITGEAHKIYVDLATNISYRFGGTTYVQITSSDMVALTNEEIEELWASA